MSSCRSLLVLTGLGAVLARPLAAQRRLEVQLFFGSSQSVPLPLTVTQAGQPDLHFTAHWSTQPTRPTWYYAWRIGFWKGDRGWRIDHTHHKLYLDNPPPEIQDFRITNGFNIFSFSRAFRSGPLTWSIGAGPVVTYPFSTVRGKRFDHENGLNGYHLSGGSVIAMATREVPLTGALVLSLDARVSASYVRVPVVDGHADVPNAALHFHAGVGYFLGKRAH